MAKAGAGAPSSKRGCRPAAAASMRQYMMWSRFQFWTAHIPYESIDATKEKWKVMRDNARKANECVDEETLMLDAFLSKKID